MILAIAPFCVAACAGTRASLNESVLRGSNYALNLGESPPGWKRIDPGGALAAFHDSGSGVAFVNARCGRRSDDIPLVALTNHLLMGTTEREFVSQETVAFNHREALHTIVNAKLDGVARSYDIFVLKKDGCVFDFVYATEPNEFAAGSQQFGRFVTSANADTGAGSGR